MALRSFVSCEVKIKINSSEQVVKCTPRFTGHHFPYGPKKRPFGWYILMVIVVPMKELSDKEDSARTKNWCGLNEF